MKISRQEVLHIAALARLGLDEKDIDIFEHQLSDILDNFEILNQLDTSCLAPTSQSVSVSNVFRADKDKKRPHNWLCPHPLVRAVTSANTTVATHPPACDSYWIITVYLLYNHSFTPSTDSRQSSNQGLCTGSGHRCIRDSKKGASHLWV